MHRQSSTSGVKLSLQSILSLQESETHLVAADGGGPEFDTPAHIRVEYNGRGKSRHRSTWAGGRRWERESEVLTPLGHLPGSSWELSPVSRPM